MKIEYFPQSNFLQASKGKNPSYIKTSLLWGRQLLFRGLGWKLGNNGDQINVWSQNWIPTKTSFKPFVNNSSQSQTLRLVDLIGAQSTT